MFPEQNTTDTLSDSREEASEEESFDPANSKEKEATDPEVIAVV